jgi:hypothetical protein
MGSTHRRIIRSDANYRAAHPSPLNAHHALADDVFSPPHRLALFTLERLPWLSARVQFAGTSRRSALAILRSRVITTGDQCAPVN